MKRIVYVIILCSAQFAHAQKMGIDLFIRLPQVVNYNFTKPTISYAPLISTGLTLRYKKAFVDVGSFIGNTNVVGHYSYFGSALYNRQSPDNWLFVTNWFGEATYFPAQQDKKSYWVQTVGISPVLVRPFHFGAFAIALTIGAAFYDDTLSLNSRIIFNYSLPIIKSRS
jgi:hypothetical protein